MSISPDLHEANKATTDKEPLYTDQKRMQVLYPRLILLSEKRDFATQNPAKN